MQMAEIIGNLNPLKIAADMIAEWRRENTKRCELNAMQRIQVVGARVEALRILVEHNHSFSQRGQKELIERIFIENCDGKG
jgi:hypothetical protein